MSKPYRPSNGAEGDIFMECFCFHCVKNGEDDPEGGCEILGRTLSFAIDDPQYPTEWIQDDDDFTGFSALCTAFQKKP